MFDMRRQVHKREQWFRIGDLDTIHVICNLSDCDVRIYVYY